MYFYRDSALRIVTEAYLYCPDTMTRITFWSETIERLLQKNEIVLSAQTELFLQIEDNDCAYYFIDHTARTEFWLDVVSTDDLNMLPVVSPTHLS